jgi:H+/Cl- antiporter ClcA
VKFENLKQQAHHYKEKAQPYIDKAEHIVSDLADPQAVALFITAGMAALLAVVYAKAFRFFEGVFVWGVGQWHWLAFILTPLTLMTSSLLVWKYSKDAAGGGLAQVRVAVEMNEPGHVVPEAQSLLSLKTAGIKILSSLVCIMGGSTIGQEGPLIQVAACLFDGMGKLLRRCRINIQPQAWIIAGGAAGLACAFNTPLGGLVYAIEELGTHHFQKVKTSLLAAILIAGLTVQAILGPYLAIGTPHLDVRGFWDVVAAAGIGLFGGILGTALGRMMIEGIKKRDQAKTKKQVLVTAGVAGLAMAALITQNIQVAGSGLELLKDFFFRSEHADIMTMLGRMLGMTLVATTFASAGNFVPSLTLGGIAGAFFAQIFHVPNESLLVSLGMISFLTAIMRAPFTSFILVLEMTDRHAAILPMMISALVAQWISQALDKESLYVYSEEKLLQRLKEKNPVVNPVPIELQQTHPS